MTRKMSRFQSALGKIAEKLDMPELAESMEAAIADDEDDINASQALQKVTPARQELRQGYEIDLDADPGPGSIPASCVSITPQAADSGARTGTSANGVPNDMVSGGRVSLSEAQRYFEIYSQKLDHYTYGIIEPGSTLATVRVSPLLTAAICAVGSLHANSPNFESYYQEFVNLSASQSFSRRNTLNDVRALIIGAFWLKEISWILIGTGKPDASYQSNLHADCEQPFALLQRFNYTAQSTKLSKVTLLLTSKHGYTISSTPVITISLWRTEDHP